MLNQQQDQSVLTLSLNRAEVKNAINDELLGLIAKALNKAQNDNTIKVVVIYGNQDFFAAGADIKELASKDMIATARDIRAQYWQQINNFNKPLIAAVNGFALGAGCELAMACDIIIAGYCAQFAQPEIKLGIIPGAGGTQRLVRAVGKSLAMQMVLTGQPIDAQKALDINLVSELTHSQLTLPRALKIAAEIAKNSSLALQFAKKTILNSFETGLSSAMDFERQCFITLAASEDRKIALEKFINRGKKNAQ